MTRLSTKALRLYDEMGLLKPAHVDPVTGYRYYRLGQAHRADFIRQLRAIDMPLAEILIYLESEKLAEETLSNHRHVLQKRMAAMKAMLAASEDLLDQSISWSITEAVITEQENMNVAAVKLTTTRDKIKVDIAQGLGVLAAEIDSGRIQAVGAPMLIYHDVIDQENEGVVEVVVPITKGSIVGGDTGISHAVVAGETVASLELHGPYRGLTTAYHKLFRWTHQQGYQLVGPTREIYLNDPSEVTETNLVTRIELPIRRGAVIND
jgi:effector-binding domain-containing protein